MKSTTSREARLRNKTAEAIQERTRKVLRQIQPEDWAEAARKLQADSPKRLARIVEQYRRAPTTQSGAPDSRFGPRERRAAETRPTAAHAARRGCAPRRSAPPQTDATTARMTGGQTAFPSSLIRSRRQPCGIRYQASKPIARRISSGCSIRSTGSRPAQVTSPKRSSVVTVRSGTSIDCQPPPPSDP